MNKVNINIHALTNKDFNPELVADMISGALKSLGLNLNQIEISKVSKAVTLKRRVKSK